MNNDNPTEAYARNARRVAWLLLWLDAELQRHKERSKAIADPCQLWPMVGCLGHAAEDLKFVLMCLSRKSEAESDKVLDAEGRGDE